MAGFHRTDTTVLIVGAGGAGLRTAIELATHDIECLVVGKRTHGDAHTTLAAGGINAALGNLDPDDRWEIHAADTIREGHFVCDPGAVELLARRAPERVCELARWGCPFDTTDRDKLAQRYFGAQTFRRTCFVGDRTGRAILETLVARARELDVAYRENVTITSLVTRDKQVLGAVGFDMNTGELLAFGSQAVVIAAGGCTSLYHRSTSRHDENTADALALAYQAGASLRDMEFIQFHPTGMVEPQECRGWLVTEAVRGEGGKLYNCDAERFMERYAPDEMELAARDVVARANAQEIREGRATDAGGVLLDISHRGRDFLEDRLPGVYERFKSLGVDIAEEPMQVAPTAHYAMGGICVDFRTGASDLDGLYSVGEATAGLHGANRLGGNSLAETVVFGQICGAHLAGVLRDSGTDQHSPPDELFEHHLDQINVLTQRRGGDTPTELVDELQRMLWEQAGILRSEDGLQEGLDQLEGLAARASGMKVDAVPGDEAFEWALNLRFMLLGAEAILRGALRREESRGAHFREDFPDQRDDWQCNLLCQRGDTGQMVLSTRVVPETPRPIQDVLDQDLHLDYHHLE